MGAKLISIATLMVVGAMVADALAHGQTTANVIDTIGNSWNTSLNTVAGKQMFGRRPTAVLGPPPVMPDLLGLFRLQGRGMAPTFNPWSRSKFSPDGVRASAGVFSQINQSVWQPINIPARVQVDIAPEYMPPWPFNGDVGYIERQAYTQNPAYGQMQALPQLPYSLRTPQPSTLPWFVTPGGMNNGG